MNTQMTEQDDVCGGFNELITKYQALPAPVSCQTYMDVAGYPHYENVCSNVLAFYLNPDEQHGLGDLMLMSLLKALGRDAFSIGQATIRREFPTVNGGRLDLLIYSEAITIGIENKIYAGVYNDLEDYAATIDDHASKYGRIAQATFKIVLSLKPERNQATLIKWRKLGFVNLTHSKLWEHVRHLLGHYAAGAQTKWLTYLLEFMQNMINLAEENLELKKTDQFFIDNNKVIDRLLTERQAFQGRLSIRLAELATLTSDLHTTGKVDTPPYTFSNDRLVLDLGTCLPKHDPIVAFDLYLTPAGWDLQLFSRGGSGAKYLSQLRDQTPLKERSESAEIMDKGKRFSVQRWPVETELDTIQQALISWVDMIHEAAHHVV